MTILSYQSIMRRAPIVRPQPRTVTKIGPYEFTQGCGPAGYDLALSEIQQLTGSWDAFVLSPGEFILASAAEQFDMPNDLMGVVHDKSSWARRGLAVQNTVIEPGWRGFLTLELTNHSPRPVRLFRGVGICQVVFHLLDAPTDHPYRGKYQLQARGPQEAI